MSQTLNSPSISMTNLAVRWREQYGSSGFNRKLYGVVSPGIYRGLQLSTSGSNNTVTVVPDATYQDHLAVYETASGYSVTFRDPSNTTYSLGLTDPSILSTWVVVCLYIVYQEGRYTSANFVAYTEAEYNALSASLKRELVVLGSVQNPSAGNPIVNITSTRRTSARPWARLVKNGGFEHGPTGTTTGYSIPFWDQRSDVNSFGSFRLSSTSPKSGYRCVELNATSTSNVGAQIDQHCEIPVTPGQSIRVAIDAWHIVNSTLGSIDVVLTWGDNADAELSTTAMQIGLTGAVDTGYRTVDTTYQVPGGAYFLKKVSLSTVNSSFNSTGVVFRADNLQVYLDTLASATDPLSDAQLEQLVASSLIVEEAATYQIGENAAALNFVKATPAGEGALQLRRKDLAGTDTPHPALSLYGRLIDIGRSVLSSAAESRLPRIETPYSVNDPYTLVLQIPRDDASVNDWVRYYVTSSGALWITINASHNGTDWIKDLNGAVATALFMDTGTDAFIIHSQVAGTNTWSTWPRGVAVTATGNVQVAGTLALSSTGAGDGAEIAAHASTTNYTITLPQQPPLATHPVVMNTSGALSTSSTLTLTDLYTTVLRTGNQIINVPLELPLTYDPAATVSLSHGSTGVHLNYSTLLVCPVIVGDDIDWIYRTEVTGLLEVGRNVDSVGVEWGGTWGGGTKTIALERFVGTSKTRTVWSINFTTSGAAFSTSLPVTVGNRTSGADDPLSASGDRWYIRVKGDSGGGDIYVSSITMLTTRP